MISKGRRTPSPCFLNVPPDYAGGFEREDLEGLLSLMEQNYIGWAAYLAPVVSGPSPVPAAPAGPDAGVVVGDEWRCVM